MRKVNIIGLGKSGIAAAKILQKNNEEVIIYDSKKTESLEKIKDNLALENITVKLGENISLKDENLPELIIISPGVPYDIPILIEARRKGIKTIGEMELAWQYLKSYPWIGITGTNGKTTTTALIEAMLKAGNIKTSACGNIGYAACELALSALENPPQWVVAEISSYQIESSQELSPKIGIWTTFTSDHLARHKTLENYHKIKASLLQRSHYKILNGDDNYLHNFGLNLHWKNTFWTSVKGKDYLLGDIEKGVYLEDSWIVAFKELIAPISLFKMVGKHNLQNLLMATAAAKLAGVSKSAIVETISSFTGVSHRLELITTINGVAYINDSKATNYDAAQVGLDSVESPVILIAGGEAKEGDDTSWINKIKEKCVLVLLIGDAANLFAENLDKAGFKNYEIVKEMDKAVFRSHEIAEEKGAKVVLLSPACASFDQYRSFEHRGDDFRELCLKITMRNPSQPQL
ncbi:MAG: UDP-N-acetylmuramoyl-L-alanine--D-glutamate ligase [Cyanobacteria bacterium]|nr:UDP-N-acetylmuramoyl-L-alanine--D-glutamate ligase [Cyanobacteria bacterium CG_2015-16_32_12]NCO79569.1 UDP-N-acetylmuramoyl-L-alanine--D-glutamate ligase [Cyanobacteria bacterium CG_2015-22_32_23]NCQ40536.1 UDP-N-acetylmuramoyl-L-alanine--D-glutamate ligase [Cyanobacteria bacterium CG_2015-04_32_10]NCS84455.1 UDP-N-acetylmuramoyl-L-alanine--D-glutamate ligase [Cyanobacteria bacterium CG_2015-02_32_10]